MSYDTWKTTEPDASSERCLRDDSTDCSCLRCVAQEDRFWGEQGESAEEDALDNDSDPGCEFCDFGCSACNPLVERGK